MECVLACIMETMRALIALSMLIWSTASVVAGTSRNGAVVRPLWSESDVCTKTLCVLINKDCLIYKGSEHANYLTPLRGREY